MYDAIDRTTSTNRKVEAMREYFAAAPGADAGWALFFLTGRRLKRLIRSRELWEWTIERTGLSPWLMHESYAVVGDFAEAMALLMDRDDLPEPAPAREPAQLELPLGGQEPEPEHFDGSLRAWAERLMLLPTMEVPRQREAVFRW